MDKITFGEVLNDPIKRKEWIETASKETLEKLDLIYNKLKEINKGK